QPADDTGGDGLEFEAGPLPWLDGADAGGGENAREGGHEAGNGEGHQLDAVGVNTDGGGSRAIAAGGKDVIAEAVAVQQRIEHQAQGDEPDEGGVDAEDRAGKEFVEHRVGIEANLNGAIEQQYRPAPEQQAAKRDD